jgi:hypothetical protein
MGFLLLLYLYRSRTAVRPARLTAVLHQEIEELLHPRVVGRVDDRSPLPPAGHETGVAQLGDVERQRIGRYPETLRELSRGEPGGPLAHEDPEELEAGRLGEGGKGVHGRL